MAGGLGSRFWPIAGSDNPKQFIDVMGVGRSMLQTTFERFERLCPRQNIIIVTGEHYAGRVREQLPGLLPYQVLAEPMRRNTAPCIAYAASVVQQMDPEAVLIVSPSDHAVFNPDKFEADVRLAVDTVAGHDWIVTLGAQPMRPDTSYGYIQFHESPSLPSVQELHKVVTFTEKPPADMARQFIASGEFLWNTGILILRLDVLRDAYRRHLPQIATAFIGLGPDTPRAELELVYSQCESVSVDNGIMETADNVHVLATSFGWSDVETWGTLYDAIPHDADGNAVVRGNVFTYDTHDCLVVMPDDSARTVVLEGLEGYIVAASDNILMVCRRSSEEQTFRFASDVELKKLIDRK